LSVPPKSIVILKNIDRFVANRSMANVNKDLTFSGLLNVIDGALAHNKGVLMILTTNRYQRLRQDEKSVDALLRPGRVSLAARFGRPSEQQLKRYFLRMFAQKGGPHPAGAARPNDAAPTRLGRRMQRQHGEMTPHHHRENVEEERDRARGDYPGRDSKKSEIDGAAGGFVSALKRVFDSKECIENGKWRCPLNWCEIKGLLMDPRIQKDHTACSEEAILRDFVHKLRVTKRLKLRKTLNEQERVLKRELRRDTDDAEDRQERERAVKDARVTLLLLNRPEIGLATEADLMRETPVIGKTVGRIRNLIQRITSGEVDKSKAENKAVKCNTCGGKLSAFPDDLFGHFCDGCGSGECAFRCPRRGCNFDICSNCYQRLADGSPL